MTKVHPIMLLCPYCRAAPGVPCSAGGLGKAKTRQAHKARRRAAEQASRGDDR